MQEGYEIIVKGVPGTQVHSERRKQPVEIIEHQRVSYRCLQIKKKQVNNPMGLELLGRMLIILVYILRCISDEEN